MVSFRSLLVSTLALSAPISAVLTPAQIVDTINTITVKSQALQAPARSITLINGPLVVIGLGPFPKIIAGLADIVVTTGLAIAQIPGTLPVPAGTPSDIIFEAFRDFVRVHQALLNILIGKAGLFNAVPFIGAPVAAVLRQIEKVVDTIAFGLIDLVQSRAADLKAEASSLSLNIDLAVKSYNGLTVKRDITFPRRHLSNEATLVTA